jgi:hypothetical protein
MKGCPLSPWVLTFVRMTETWLAFVFASEASRYGFPPPRE